jgi:hypothetical protein
LIIAIVRGQEEEGHRVFSVMERQGAVQVSGIGAHF